MPANLETNLAREELRPENIALEVVATEESAETIHPIIITGDTPAERIPSEKIPDGNNNGSNEKSADSAKKSDNSIILEKDRRLPAMPADKPHTGTVLITGNGSFHAVMEILTEAKKKVLKGLGVETICDGTAEKDLSRESTISTIHQLLKKGVIVKTFSADTLENSAVALASNAERGIFKN